jgi:hypothetical protein
MDTCSKGKHDSEQTQFLDVLTRDGRRRDFTHLTLAHSAQWRRSELRSDVSRPRHRVEHRRAGIRSVNVDGYAAGGDSFGAMGSRRARPA